MRGPENVVQTGTWNAGGTDLLLLTPHFLMGTWIILAKHHRDCATCAASAADVGSMLLCSAEPAINFGTAVAGVGNLRVWLVLYK